MEGQGGEPQSHTFGVRESNWPLAYVTAEDAASCFELLDLHANILLLLQRRKSDFFFFSIISAIYLIPSNPPKTTAERMMSCLVPGNVLLKFQINFIRLFL